MSFNRLVLSFCHFDLRDFSEAEKLATEALRLAQMNRERHLEGFSSMQVGRCKGKATGTAFDAGNFIQKGMMILNELGIKPLFSLGHFFLGEVYVGAGEKEKALENLRKAQVTFEGMGMDYWLGRTRKLLDNL